MSRAIFKTYLHTQKSVVYLKLSFNRASVLFYLLNWTTQGTLLSEKEQVFKPYI